MMNNLKPVVLVIEDLDWPKIALNRALGKKIDFRMTSSIQEAREEIQKEPLADLVVLNARVHGPVSDSIELAREIKTAIPGIIIIGTSNTSSFQDKLVGAGCDYATDQSSLVPSLEHFLGL